MKQKLFSKKENAIKKQQTRRKAYKLIFTLFLSAILVFLVISAIAYQKGIFDISFIERETSAQSSSSTVNPGTPSSVDPDVNADSAEISSDSEKPQLSVADYISSLDSTSELTDNGYEITDKIYGSDFVITLSAPEVRIDNIFSSNKKTVKTPVRIPNGTDSGYITQINDVETDRPAVEVYMDYLIVDNGDSFTLLSKDGAVLVEDFDIEHYVPAYTRDNNDNPLFAAEEPSSYNKKVTVTKYYYIDENGEFKASKYNDKTDNRGLYTNYPSYFGKPQSDDSSSSMTIHYDSKLGLFGYGSKSGVDSQEDFRYIAAFNHSEGLCAAVETDGLLYFFEEDMDTHISAEYEFYKIYSNTRRRLLRHLLLPDTFGEETLGFFYFDHGLCRVRAQTIDAWHWQQYQKRYINADEDILIRIDGTEFPIPSDYKLISYSNGVLLLEKNGIYGYMDYTGKWITNPVYTCAQPFHEGLAVIGTEGNLGMIDTDGNVVIPTVFDYISNTSGGIIAAYDNETGWYIFNKVAQTQAVDSE